MQTSDATVNPNQNAKAGKNRPEIEGEKAAYHSLYPEIYVQEILQLCRRS